MNINGKYLVYLCILVLVPGILAATFSNLEVHLEDHNSNILFDTSVDFDSFELYSNSVEIDDRNISIYSDDSSEFDSNITYFDIVGDGQVLELSTEAEEGTTVTYDFDGPDGEYLIERDGEEQEVQTVSGNLEWEYQFTDESHQFTVIENIDREVWIEDFSTNNTNTDHKDTDIQMDAFASITDEVNIQLHKDDGEMVNSVTVDNSSEASFNLGEDELDPQNAYQGYVNVSDGSLWETKRFNFTTVNVGLEWEDTADIEDGFIIESNHTEGENYEIELPQETEETRLTHSELEFSQYFCVNVSAFNVGGVSETTQDCINTLEQPDDRPWE